MQSTTSRFESAVLEQLDAAYNLARWLMRNDQDAQDVVQESCMKALRAFDSFRRGNVGDNGYDFGRIVTKQPREKLFRENTLARL